MTRSFERARFSQPASLSLLLLSLTLGACASAPPTPPPGRTPRVHARPPSRPPVVDMDDSAAAALEAEVRAPVVLLSVAGEATYYADKFDGRLTANGTVFRNSEPYAAHREYPFGTVVRVTNTANGRSVVVTVVDRGPHGTSERARRTIIDLSRSAAEELGFVRAGRTRVRVDVLEWGDGRTHW